MDADDSIDLSVSPYDLVGNLIDKKCPKCNSQLLSNAVGDEWCSSIQCDFGCKETNKLLGL